MTEGTRDFEELLAVALESLSTVRPVFHSEADFQFALAWEIGRQVPHAAIRLEKRVASAPVVALDVLLSVDRRHYAIELKYLRAPFDVMVGDEHFRLVEGTGDLDSYDTLRDISRLERLVDDGIADAGALVALTNSPSFWSPPIPSAPDRFDAFRFHDGATLGGTLDWGASAGPGTRKQRELPIALRWSYSPHWQSFSKLAGARNGEFRSLTVHIRYDRDEPAATPRQRGQTDTSTVDSESSL